MIMSWNLLSFHGSNKPQQENEPITSWNLLFQGNNRTQENETTMNQNLSFQGSNRLQQEHETIMSQSSLLSQGNNRPREEKMKRKKIEEGGLPPFYS